MVESSIHCHLLHKGHWIILVDVVVNAFCKEIVLRGYFESIRAVDVRLPGGHNFEMYRWNYIYDFYISCSCIRKDN